jgi:two-component system, cell cycle response regulator
LILAEDRKFKVLVADDEESLRGIVKEILTDSGYLVDCAANGKEAMDLVRKNSYEVVVSDIRMPEMSGIELLEEIKKFNPNIQVIMMTSHASVETAIKAIRLGAYDYLTKPFEDLDIITTVINRTVEKLKLETKIKELLEELSIKNEEMQVLYQCSIELTTTLKLDEILKLAISSISKLCKCTNVIFWGYNHEDNTIVGKYSNIMPEDQLALMKHELKGTKSIANYFVIVDSDVELKKRMNLVQDITKLNFFPLNIGGKFTGMFSVYSQDEKALIKKEGKELIKQFVGNVSMQAENAYLHQMIKSLAIRDGLTNLYNHRYFQNQLTAELERAKRYGKEFSVILFDLDHFKNYNDKLGHPQGDYLLREVATIINKSKRNIDLAARYGGEEFVLILVETNKSGAALVAERLRKAIEEYPFQNREIQPLGKISVSVGYSSYPADGDTREVLVKTADENLYKAKHAGRNRIHPPLS